MKEANMAEELTTEDLQEQQEPHGDKQRAEIDWKAEARKWEGRSKENAERLKTLESEHAESKAKLDEFEQRATQAEQEANDLRKQKELSELTLSVATEYKLPEPVVRALKGDTREELAANADILKAWVGTAPVITDGGKSTTPPKTNKDEFNKFWSENFQK